MFYFPCHKQTKFSCLGWIELSPFLTFVENSVCDYFDFEIMVVATRGNPRRNQDPIPNCEELSPSEKICLRSSIKPLNFKFAKREHVVGYLNLLKSKIGAIRRCTRLGKDFSQLPLKFGTEFVYKMMVDMFVLLDDYLRLKDQMLYQKCAEDCRSLAFPACDDCETENLFEPTKNKSIQTDCCC